MQVKRNSKKKFIDSESKATKLYSQTPIWLAMLKVGGTGLLMSFMMALFTFLDQLMLINLMPGTHAFSFEALFLNGHTVFEPLVVGLNNVNGETINAIANTTGLGIYDSADIVRSAVSLSSALIFLVQNLPGVISMGIVILYSKSLGAGRLDGAKEIWQNSLVASSLAALIGFVILIILVPTVTPAQATNTQLTVANLQSTTNSIMNQLEKAGFSSDFFNGGTYTIYTNGKDYFVSVMMNNQQGYLNVTDQSLLSGNYHLITNPGNLQAFSFSSNQLLQSWNNYFMLVHNYSIKWAENFLFIMTIVFVLETFANNLIGILRADGEIKVTSIITVITIAANILLDWLFIGVAQIGMEGAATASVVGFALQIIVLSCYVQFRRNSQIRFNDWKHIHVNWRLIGQFAKFGINSLAGNVGLMVTTILLTREITVVAGHVLPSAGSEYYISIVGAVMPFVTLFFSSVGGFAKNTVQLYSFNMGEKDYKRVKQAYWYAFAYLLIMGLVIFGLFGCCEPIQTGVLNWFHINGSSPDNQLASSEKLMMIWMSQVPIFAFMINALIVFLVSGRIKTAILVSLIRAVIVPIPMIYIWGSIAMNCFGTHLSEVPSQNAAMWFFMSITPCYTAVYSAILFTMSTIFLYTRMFKKPLTKDPTELEEDNKPINNPNLNSNSSVDNAVEFQPITTGSPVSDSAPTSGNHNAIS